MHFSQPEAPGTDVAGPGFRDPSSASPARPCPKEAAQLPDGGEEEAGLNALMSFSPKTVCFVIAYNAYVLRNKQVSCGLDKAGFIPKHPHERGWDLQLLPDDHAEQAPQRSSLQSGGHQVSQQALAVLIRLSPEATLGPKGPAPGNSGAGRNSRGQEGTVGAPPSWWSWSAWAHCRPHL